MQLLIKLEEIKHFFKEDLELFVILLRSKPNRTWTEAS